MLAVFRALIIIAFLAGVASSDEVTKAELEAKLETVQAKREAVLSDFRFAQAMMENARLKDQILAAQEKALQDKIAALTQKDKPEDKTTGKK